MPMMAPRWPFFPPPKGWFWTLRSPKEFLVELDGLPEKLGTYSPLPPPNVHSLYLNLVFFFFFCLFPLPMETLNLSLWTEDFPFI